MRKIIFLCLWMLSTSAQATEWLHDLEVIKVGTYQSATVHFVWFTATFPGCTKATPSNPVMNFDDTKAGGKALLATLISALVSKRKVDVQAEGCQIIEVHLK